MCIMAFVKSTYLTQVKASRTGLVLLACALVSLATSSISIAADKFKAITTFTVIADMARNVGGDMIIVESITRPGAEIHHYSPTPRDILRAQDADLILWNGMNLELWFSRFFTNLKDVPEVVLSDGVIPIDIADGSYKGKPNPHAWMSPDNALVYIDNIVDALSRHDPANAATYRQNGAAYKAESDSLCRAPARDDQEHPRRPALACHLRRGVQLSCARSWPAGDVSVADQCRSTGHAPAGTPRY